MAFPTVVSFDTGEQLSIVKEQKQDFSLYRDVGWS